MHGFLQKIVHCWESHFQFHEMEWTPRGNLKNREKPPLQTMHIHVPYRPVLPAHPKAQNPIQAWLEGEKGNIFNQLTYKTTTVADQVSSTNKRFQLLSDLRCPLFFFYTSGVRHRNNRLIYWTVYCIIWAHQLNFRHRHLKDSNSKLDLLHVVGLLMSCHLRNSLFNRKRNSSCSTKVDFFFSSDDLFLFLHGSFGIS